MANLWLPGNAGTGDVRSGKKFGAGGDYDAEGTLTDNGTGGTITPGTSDQTVAAGIWDTDVIVAGDPNLVTGNIKAGETIFGVAGDTNVLDTSIGASTAATAADILATKEAYANGALVTGTMPNQGTVQFVPGAQNESGAAGYYESIDVLQSYAEGPNLAVTIGDGTITVSASLVTHINHITLLFTSVDNNQAPGWISTDDAMFYYFAGGIEYSGAITTTGLGTSSVTITGGFGPAFESANATLAVGSCVAS